MSRASTALSGTQILDGLMPCLGSLVSLGIVSLTYRFVTGRSMTQAGVTNVLLSPEAAELGQELLRALGWRRGFPTVDVGPTTACAECPRIIPIGEAYFQSTTRGEVALCEGCFQRAEAAGRARVAEATQRGAGDGPGV